MITDSQSSPNMLTDFSQSPPKCPPENIEAEEAILGGILLDPSAIARIADYLVPEAFYVSSHVTIYRHCLAMHRKGEPVDLMTVMTRLRDKGQIDNVGGINKLAQLVDNTVSAVNIDRYSMLVMDKYVRRQLISTAHDLIDVGHDTDWDLEHCLDYLQREAEKLLHYKFQGGDKEYKAFLALIDEIKQIEQTIIDPGFRYYKLIKLAERRKTSLKSLEAVYLRYLASQENETIVAVEELRKRYGSNVQEWFLHGFAPKGAVVLLHALGGMGKTRLIYDWIYSMVCGIPWGKGKNGEGQSFQVTAPSRRVLVVQTDESQGDLLNTLDARGFTDEMPIRFKTRWTTGHMAALRKDIEEWQPEVILIDSLTSVSRNSTFSENDTEYARPVLELRDLAQEFGCLIYLVHHSNSEGKSRGTKAIFNSVSHVFSLSRPSEGSDPRTLDRILCVEKSRSRAPAKYKLRFEPENSSWICEGAEGIADDGRDIKDRVISFLAENANICYDPVEICQAIGGSLDRVRLCCYQLAGDGEICRKRREKQGGGYLYFVKFDYGEGDRLGGDHLPITFPITFVNPVPETVSGEGDRAVAKKSLTEESKSGKIFNDPITFSQNSVTESDYKGDREGDREGDRVVGDHLLPDNAIEEECEKNTLFQAGDKLIWTNPASGEKVAATVQPTPSNWKEKVKIQTATLEILAVAVAELSPAPFKIGEKVEYQDKYYKVLACGFKTIRLEGMSQKVDIKDCQPIKPRVRYIGSNWEVQKFTRLHSYLEVIEVKADAMVIVTAKGWIAPMEIPFADLVAIAEG